MKTIKNLISFQMEEAVWGFDAELRLLRHEKQKLDVQMKLADLRQVVLLVELQLLKEFEKRENILQERLNKYIQEEQEITVRETHTINMSMSDHLQM